MFDNLQGAFISFFFFYSPHNEYLRLGTGKEQNILKNAILVLQSFSWMQRGLCAFPNEDSSLSIKIDSESLHFQLGYWDRLRMDNIFDNGKTLAYVDVSEERKEEMRNIIEVISASDKERALRIMTLLEIIDEKLQRHINTQIEMEESLDREIEGEEETTFSNLSSLRHRPIIPFVEQ